MKNIRILISVFAAIFALGCLHNKIAYRKIDDNWQIEGDRFWDSTQFFSRDTLFFYAGIEDEHNDHLVNTLTFDKHDHRFSCSIRNNGLSGLYSINHAKKLLILSDCETPTEDTKTWIKKKSDTFTIVKLNDSELVLTRKK